MDESLYFQKIVEITQDYLGPAAARFVERQIRTHLNKDPQEIGRSDIPMLALRIRSGLVVLTHDETVVEECFQRVASVADNSHHEPVTI